MTELRPAPYSRDYEITDAMFGAFRSPGGAPFFWKLFAWGTLLYTIALALTLVPIVNVYIEIFRTISAIDESGQNTAEAYESFGLFMKLIPLFILMMIAILVVQSLLQAAFYRAYYENDLGGGFPFRFGGDEMRQGLSLLGYFGIFTLIYAAAILLFVVLAGLGGALGEGGGAVAGLLIFVAVIGLLVVVVWGLVTFSPATALTAYRGQVHVLAARHVTKNRFWALFGSLLVVYLLTYVVQTVVSSVGMTALFSSFFDADLFTSLESDDVSAARTQLEAILASTSFKISAFIALIAFAASYAFTGLMFMGPVAFFTRQWAGAQADRVDY